MKRVVLVVVVVAMGLVLAVAAAATGTEEPSATLNFVVLKDYNGKPVRNAAVVLHPVNSHGKQGRGGYELKTDMDGKTTVKLKRPQEQYSVYDQHPDQNKKDEK